jgi:hypothetical protein
VQWGRGFGSVRASVVLSGAGTGAHADAVGLINDLGKRRRTMLGFPTDDERQLLRWEDDGGRGVVFLDAIVNPFVVEEIIIKGLSLTKT